jgi:mRNA-degrading endonuclease toxin of MazEF toxin-antitoxin module
MAKIVYAPFPYLEENRSKNRPLLVLAENKDQYDTVIVAYITSQIDKNILPSDILLLQKDDFFEQTGLSLDCAIKLNKLGCIPKSIIKYEIGTLPEKQIALVKTKLRQIFNL